MEGLNNRILGVILTGRGPKVLPIKAVFLPKGLA
jgi:hypothetical protein